MTSTTVSTFALWVESLIMYSTRRPKTTTIGAIFHANFLREWRCVTRKSSGKRVAKSRLPWWRQHVRNAQSCRNIFFNSWGRKSGKSHHMSASLRAHPYRAWELWKHIRVLPLSDFQHFLLLLGFPRQHTLNAICSHQWIFQNNAL